MWIERRVTRTLVALLVFSIVSVPMAFVAYSMVGLSGPVLENQIAASESETLTPIGDHLTGWRTLGLLGGLVPFMLVLLTMRQLISLLLKQEENLLRQLLDTFQGIMQASIVMQFCFQAFMVLYPERADFVDTAQRLNAIVFVLFHLSAGLCYVLIGGALLLRPHLRAPRFAFIPRPINAGMMLGGLTSFTLSLFMLNAPANPFPVGFLFLPYCAGVVMMVLYLSLLPKADDQITYP